MGDRWRHLWLPPVLAAGSGGAGHVGGRAPLGSHDCLCLWLLGSAASLAALVGGCVAGLRRGRALPEFALLAYGAAVIGTEPQLFVDNAGGVLRVAGWLVPAAAAVAVMPRRESVAAACGAALLLF